MIEALILVVVIMVGMKFILDDVYHKGYVHGLKVGKRQGVKNE